MAQWLERHLGMRYPKRWMSWVRIPPVALIAVVTKPLLSSRMKDKKDVYHFDRSLRGARALLEKSAIRQEDKELIKGFITHLEALNVGLGRSRAGVNPSRRMRLGKRFVIEGLAEAGLARPCCRGARACHSREHLSFQLQLMARLLG